jgi:molybdate transport system substrate-binding protein
MKPNRTIQRVAVAFAIAVAIAARTHGGQLTVMTSGAFTAPYLELSGQFAQTTHTEIITAATTMGAGTASIPSRVRRGEAVDVVILADSALEDLIRDGLVVADSKVRLARSTIGMVVRSGARKPDISTPRALKRALLNARSIAYSASVSGDYLANDLFPRLGIAEQVRLKSRRIDGERVAAVVARGEAEIGFQQISELLPVPGIDFVGPLPPSLQKVTVFSAGVVARSKNMDAARALVRFLSSREAAAVIRRSGLAPM